MMKNAIAVCLGVAAAMMVPYAARAEDAASILEATGVKGGLVVHLGCGSGELTAALRANESYLVHGLDADAANVEQARAHIMAQGLYGPVSAEQLKGDRLPYADSIVNLLVAEVTGDVSTEEMMRVVAPLGVAYVKQGGTSKDPEPVEGWRKTVKPYPDDIDEWTHYLHDASGNAVAHDTVMGPPRRLQWEGGPKWDRNHDHLNSISALVTSAGRIFYIVDKGSRASILLPARWFLAARDAFSGVDLWERPVTSWVNHLRAFRSGPVRITRRLVAKGERVFVTLGADAPLVALDAATGKTLKTYEGTERTGEIILSGNTLFLTVDKESQAKTDFVMAGYSVPVSVVAVNADSGEVVWKKDVGGYFPLTLAALAERVCFKDGDDVVCVNRDTGDELWRAAMPPQMEVKVEKHGKKTGTEWFAGTLVMYEGVVLYADGKLVTAVSASDGTKLWDTPCEVGFQSPPDVLVADGLVWVGTSHRRDGPDFCEGRDPLTGNVERSFPKRDRGGMHHRCYRAQATDRYILWGRGVAFTSVTDKSLVEYLWIRGSCQYGVMPANGMLYLPSHSCACQTAYKINGFYAVAPGQARAAADADAQDGTLEKGPAYAAIQESAARQNGPDDWPMYRRDAVRSGHTPSAVPATLKDLWTYDVGGLPSSVTVAGGQMYVADADACTLFAVDAGDGSVLWRRTVGGRIDSPPSVYGDLVIFGSADGHVYCLRASDGELAWRFRAGSEDRRIVSYGRVTSVRAMPGGVLLDGLPADEGQVSVYVAAGLSSMLDQGIGIYRLDPVTGGRLAGSRFYGFDPGTGNAVKGKNTKARGGILSADDTGIYMRLVKMDRETLEQIPATPHLHAGLGLLDDSWFHRNYWTMAETMGGNYAGWWKAAGESPSGRILVFDESGIYGFGRTRVANMIHHKGKAKGSPHHIFAMQRIGNGEQAANGKKKRSAKKSYLWSQEVPFMARAMVLAGDTLFVAGPKGEYREPGAVDGTGGAVLAAVSTADGKVLAEYDLDAVPVWDGMAAAGGKLYVALTNGRVICMGEK